METNNNKGYIIFDLLFSMVNTLLLIILIYVAYKISNHSIKSLLYISIVLIALVIQNNLKCLKKELSE